MFATDSDSLAGQSGGARITQRTRTVTLASHEIALPAPRTPPDDIEQVLERRPESAAVARHTARAVLDAWRIGTSTTDAVLLVVSELVTNAVQHAEGPIVLHLHRERAGNRLWIGVTDGGPSPAPAHRRHEHGRGQHLIAALTDRNGSHTHAHGATHWAYLKTS
ncbi:ATP-binding protein [Streptomyces sp. NPDC004787]|uniref:ATP-binding protein n=1 Tax=Streptomyces sp. NPDC004787 TaxID=3154291 RepID=UPI0033ADB27C